MDDSDETEGRKLYRQRADALASSQIAMAKRRVAIEGKVDGGKRRCYKCAANDQKRD